MKEIFLNKRKLEHDIGVFSRIMENYPEEDYQFFLIRFCDTGYYYYKDIDPLWRMYENMQMPHNIFLYSKIERSKTIVQETLKDLLHFTSVNCESVNTEVAQVNQFKEIDDYNVQTDKVLKLMDDLRYVISNFITAYSSFRNIVLKKLMV